MLKIEKDKGINYYAVIPYDYLVKNREKLTAFLKTKFREASHASAPTLREGAIIKIYEGKNFAYGWIGWIGDKDKEIKLSELLDYIGMTSNKNLLLLL